RAAGAAPSGARGRLRSLLSLLLPAARLAALLGGGAALRLSRRRARAGPRGARAGPRRPRAGGRAAARARRRARGPARLLPASGTSAASTLGHLLPLLGPATCGLTLARWTALSHLEASEDRRVVRQPEAKAVGVEKLPLLRRKARRPLDHLEPAGEDVVDRVGCGRVAQLEALAQLREHLRVARRAEVQVAAEDERVTGGPLDGGGRRGEGLARGLLRQARGRVQVRDADGLAALEADARPQHAASLGARRERQPALLEDLSGGAHEELVRAALP